MLIGLSAVMLYEAPSGDGGHHAVAPSLPPGIGRFAAGVASGFGIGVVAAVLGVRLADRTSRSHPSRLCDQDASSLETSGKGGTCC